MDLTINEKKPEGCGKFGLNNSTAQFTVDDAVNKAGYGQFQIRLTFLAGLGWLADSFEIIILSLIGDLIACDWPLPRWQNALLTSVVFMGMMIGSPIFGTAADVYGRRKSLAVSVTLLFLFGAVSAASPSFVWMAIFRGCMGFALGGVAQGLTLCCEYFPSNIRGKAGFYLCYFWSLGTLGVILMTWLIMDYLDNWRILLVAASIPAFLVIVSLKWYPESARFFLVSNQHDKAETILQKMAAQNDKDLPPGHLVQISTMAKRGRIQDLLSKEYRRATFLFWYIWLAVAFAYYAICLVSPTIIQHGSLRTASSENSTAASYFDDLDILVPCVKFTRQNYVDLLWTSAAEFPGLIVFTFLIEHMRRKVLLGVSLLISGVLVILLLLKTHHILIFIFLFGVRGIILADFQLIFVMTTEAFPTTVRAIAMGTGSAFCRLGGLIVPYVAQVLVIKNPVAAIGLLSGVIFLAAIAAALLPFETKGAVMKESQDTNR
ncbi:synaptic vesicle 2-related protein-like [Uloborus diversus]|uniref:synaptic vesicle 2-related protein-like n=1 Tax=Uloborus diversus TaxID=327109 RepID=UPI002409D35A|nr:synaptic vesicle 2-related protein-like [Uloborus diversus]